MWGAGLLALTLAAPASAQVIQYPVTPFPAAPTAPPTHGEPRFIPPTANQPATNPYPFPMNGSNGAGVSTGAAGEGRCAACEEHAKKGFCSRLYDRLTGSCCQGHHNDFGCTSWKADGVFAFGSCRAFWGEPCRKAPPRSYDNWPGIFKP